MIFVDTSAFFAPLDDGDRFQAAARVTWESLLNAQSPLVTSNYVLLETAALLQRRLGMAALTRWDSFYRPVVETIWIDQRNHEAALHTVLLAGRRDLSLVDCSTFVTMREHGITRVFTFDAHFREQGFDVLPAA